MDLNNKILEKLKELADQVGTEETRKMIRELAAEGRIFVATEVADFSGNRPNLAGERTIKVCAQDHGK